MKKTLAILLLSLMAFSVFAHEEPQNEFQVKIGLFPYVESVICAFGQINNDGEPIMLPVITAEYLRYVNSRNGIGFSFTYGTPYATFGGENANMSYASLGFTYRGIYMNKENVKLYGELGVGGELLFSIKNPMCQPLWSFHVSPLGIWFGSDKFFGTAELTFGSEGLATTLGIGTRF